jgi:threonine/homoserine/homoserine lactone efflux protein
MKNLIYSIVWIVLMNLAAAGVAQYKTGFNWVFIVLGLAGVVYLHIKQKKSEVKGD